MNNKKTYIEKTNTQNFGCIVSAIVRLKALAVFPPCQSCVRSIQCIDCWDF